MPLVSWSIARGSRPVKGPIAAVVAPSSPTPAVVCSATVDRGPCGRHARERGDLSERRICRGDEPDRIEGRRQSAGSSQLVAGLTETTGTEVGATAEQRAERHERPPAIGCGACLA